MRKILYAFVFVCLSIVLMGCDPLDAVPVVNDEPDVVETLRERPQGDDTVKVGILAIRSASATNAQYGALIAYLEEEIGRPFSLVTMTQNEQFQLVEQRELDFVFSNPLAAIQIQRLYGTKILGTLSRPNTGTEFGGLIIAHRDSGIESLEGLRGKNVTCVSHQTAAAGCNFQVFHLLQSGIDPFRDFESFTETPSQDNIVLGVLNGQVDAGFIRTGQLERMLSEGTLPSLEEIRILDQADDPFFFPHTTRLYPEWAFAALNDTETELTTQVRDALLNLEANHPVMQSARAERFVAGVDYAPLDELIVGLKLLSWDVDNRLE